MAYLPQPPELHRRSSHACACIRPADALASSDDDLSLLALAKATTDVIEDKDTAALNLLAIVGGSPHGAPPRRWFSSMKALASSARAKVGPDFQHRAAQGTSADGELGGLVTTRSDATNLSRTWPTSPAWCALTTTCSIRRRSLPSRNFWATFMRRATSTCRL